MITSNDVRDYIDGKLREMREAHNGWVCLEAKGAFYASGETTQIHWQAYSANGVFSPQMESAEAAVEWLKESRANTAKRIREEAQALHDKSEELFRQAEELETKTP